MLVALMASCGLPLLPVAQPFDASLFCTTAKMLPNERNAQLLALLRKLGRVTLGNPVGGYETPVVTPDGHVVQRVWTMKNGTRITFLRRVG